MLPVHVRIVDADTMKPIAVRLRVTDGAGRSCVPFGRPATFRTGPGEDVGGQVRIGGEDWYYVDGGAEMFIPPGPVRVQAWHGFEYLPLDQMLDVKAGQLAIRLQMRRWTDERATGWYSGDAAVFEIDPFSALLEGAAEDLAVVNVLAREGRDGRITNMTAFSGAAPALERSGHLVTVGTCNSHPVLGSLVLLGCHRPVFPLRFGDPDGRLDWSICDWCDQAHRKKDGVVLWSSDSAGAAGELLAAALLGKVDGMVFTTPSPADAWERWYHLLNVGVRLAVVGGSRKDSNASPLGEMRTYARIPAGEPLTFSAWLAAIQAGRTYATGRALLTLRVVDRGPGETCTMAPGRLAVVAESRSALGRRTDGSVLELVHCGQVIDAGTCDSITAEVAIERSGWIAARLRCHDHVLAHTTPVYVEVEGHPVSPAAEAVAALRADLENTRRWAATAPGEDRFRRQLLANLDAVEARVKRISAGFGERGASAP